MAAIMMSVFKKGSRNSFNNERESDESVRNYEAIFGVRFPHTDTVGEIMRRRDEKCFERLKTHLSDRTFFRVCRENGWEFIVSFGDGNLPPVWEEVSVLKGLSEENRRLTESYRSGKKIVSTYTWVNDIDYHGFMPDRSECIGESECKAVRSVSVGSLKADYSGVKKITEAGRMRWKIENGGFDIQKNHGYELGHKYSRVSVTATKNYCQCMQIAHIINQLFESSSLFAPFLTEKMTVKHLWECMPGELRVIILNFKILKGLLKCRIQFRYT